MKRFDINELHMEMDILQGKEEITNLACRLAGCKLYSNPTTKTKK